MLASGLAARVVILAVGAAIMAATRAGRLAVVVMVVLEVVHKAAASAAHVVEADSVATAGLVAVMTAVDTLAVANSPQRFRAVPDIRR